MDSRSIRERQHVAFARLLLAESQPDQALNLLTPLLERATVMRQWNHVLEMWLLQIRAYHMLQRQREAVSLLTQAVHLSAPEGDIRHFVDGGQLSLHCFSNSENRNTRWKLFSI